MSRFVCRTAAGDEDLRQILDLQRRNVEERLAPDEVAADGFVTLRHDLALLRDMNRAGPHVLAESDGRVVGYALVMLRAFEERVPALGHMHARLRELSFRGRPLDELRYFIMGQVCVDKAFRGRGVFAGMYAKMRELYADRYDLVVTEVARRNGRSVRAHEKVGFRVLERYRDEEGEEWDLIFWDWSSVPGDARKGASPRL